MEGVRRKKPMAISESFGVLLRGSRSRREIFQARIIVLVENKIESLEIGSHR